MKQKEKKVVAPSEQCDRWPWMSGMQLVHTSYFKAQSLPFFADFSLQPQRALSLLQFQGTTLNVFVAAVETKEQLAVKGIQRTERKKNLHFFLSEAECGGSFHVFVLRCLVGTGRLFR